MQANHFQILVHYKIPKVPYFFCRLRASVSYAYQYGFRMVRGFDGLGV